MRLVALFMICGVLAGGCQRSASMAREHRAATRGRPYDADLNVGGSLFDGKTLGRWQAADFLDAGDVHVEDGRIILEKGEELTGIVWTGPVLRTNYEISLEAMRVEGEDFFCGLTFPVGEDHCSLIIGGWHGKVVGLSNIDLMDASENATTILLDFEKNRGYAIRLRVTADRVTAWIDGDKVVDADIAGRIIDIRGSVEPCCPLGIASWKTTAAVRNITLRAIESAEKAD